MAGELEIAYVGQASDIRDRMYQHVFWTLGGAYYLYETDYLREGRIGRGNEGVVYTPGLEGLMNSYLLRLGDLQQVAVENLRCYRYFWAEVRSWSGAASQDRRQVESALISRARTESPCLQNGSLSSAPIPRNVLTVKSEFGESGGVRALYSPIVYLADRPATS
ncbi:MAG: hypothetical protein H6716_22910 [Polyangiaceae bacterium]|nr:hypothetical protein [Polyangiaceae bacterium]